MTLNQSIAYEKIIDRITDAFFVINPEGILTYASASVSKVLGYSPDELLGRSSLEFIHQDEHHFAYSNQEKLLAYPGSRLSHDYRILNGQKEYQWLECIFVNMINIPQVGGIMVQMRDVSERKNVELLLEESREQFSLFMGKVPGAAWIRDEEGRYIFVNEAFERLRGVRADDVIGKKFNEVFPDKAESIADTDRLCRDYGKEIEFMEQCAEPSGIMKDWVIYKFPIPRATGKTFIGAFGFDVSRVILGKAAIQSAESKFKVIFDQAPDAIFIEDENGNILDANRKSCELQALHLDEIIGKNILDLTPKHKHEEVRLQYQQLWKGETNVLRSFTWNSRGEEIPVEIHASKIHHQGKPALILTLRDMRSTPQTI